MSVSPDTPYKINPLPMEMCQGCMHNGCYPWNRNPLLLCVKMGGLLPAVFVTGEEYESDMVVGCLQFKLVSEEDWAVCLKDLMRDAIHNEEMRMRSLIHENPVYSSEQLPAEYVQELGRVGGGRREDGSLYYWKDRLCHDCKAKPGELHELGCDVEMCPVCDRQLISCPESHFKLVEQGKYKRIPYIPRLVFCSICGILFPEFFNVSDREWDKYVPPQLQDKVLCRPCYDELKEIFPRGWRDKSA